MGFIKERLPKVLEERGQKQREKWEQKLEDAAKRRTPVEVEITTFSGQGEYGILVNNREVAAEFDRTAAKSQEKLIRELLKHKGYEVL